MAETPWTPDQKLRADATDRQLVERHGWWWNEYGLRDEAWIATAREFAQVCKGVEERKCLCAYGPSLDVAIACVSEDTRVDPLTVREIEDAFHPNTIDKFPEAETEYIQNFGKNPVTVREVVLARALRPAGVSEDTELLDWFDAQRENDVADDGYGGQDLVGSIWQIEAQTMSLREALRAARRPAPTRPEGTNGTR